MLIGLARALFTAFFLFFAAVIFILIRTLAPFPYDHINSILIMLTFFIFFRGLAGSLWFALIVGYILELYSSMPFGAVVFPLVSAVAITFLFCDRFLNHFSLLSFFISLCLLLSVNRLLLWVFFVIERGSVVGSVDMTEITRFMWEVCLSCITMAIIYMGMKRLYKTYNPQYVRTQNFS